MNPIPTAQLLLRIFLQQFRHHRMKFHHRQFLFRRDPADDLRAIEEPRFVAGSYTAGVECPVLIVRRRRNQHDLLPCPQQPVHHGGKVVPVGIERTGTGREGLFVRCARTVVAAADVVHAEHHEHPVRATVEQIESDPSQSAGRRVSRDAGIDDPNRRIGMTKRFKELKFIKINSAVSNAVSEEGNLFIRPERCNLHPIRSRKERESQQDRSRKLFQEFHRRLLPGL